MGNLVQLTYFSAVSSHWTPFDTKAILQVARKHNASHGISGLLLFDKGQFLQVLEGDLEPVAALFQSIKRDRRHVGVTLIFRQPIARRDFAGWSMAFHDLSAIGSDAAGYSEFLRQNFDIGSIDATATRSLLQLFKRRA
jgi:hypothetical protein